MNPIEATMLDRVLEDLPQTSPADEHNQKLVAHVHPTDWVMPGLRSDPVDHTS